MRQKLDVTLVIKLNRCFHYVPGNENTSAFAIKHDFTLSLVNSFA
ncbi:hypothetical protein ACVGWB_23800 [Enterobacter mori]